MQNTLQTHQDLVGCNAYFGRKSDRLWLILNVEDEICICPSDMRRIVIVLTRLWPSSSRCEKVTRTIEVTRKLLPKHINKKVKIRYEHINKTITILPKKDTDVVVIE